jgi:hypothetical protein
MSLASRALLASWGLLAAGCTFPRLLVPDALRDAGGATVEVQRDLGGVQVADVRAERDGATEQTRQGENLLGASTRAHQVKSAFALQAPRGTPPRRFECVRSVRIAEGAVLDPGAGRQRLDRTLHCEQARAPGAAGAPAGVLHLAQAGGSEGEVPVRGEVELDGVRLQVDSAHQTDQGRMEGVLGFTVREGGRVLALVQTVNGDQVWLAQGLSAAQRAAVGLAACALLLQGDWESEDTSVLGGD